MTTIDSSCEFPTDITKPYHDEVSTIIPSSPSSATTMSEAAAAAVAADTTVTSSSTMVYRALVIDSGPFIRMTGLTSLRNKAQFYFTVPAVVQEIRDAKARIHFQTALPFDITTREPSSEGIKAIIEFSRKTGDFTSLSSVDIQVLALQYDLEKEGCHGSMDHIRTTPKRKLGVGRVIAMGGEAKERTTAQATKEQESMLQHDAKTKAPTIHEILNEKTEFFEGTEFDIVDDSDDEHAEEEEDDDDDEIEQAENEQQLPDAPKTWASIVNPAAPARLSAAESNRVTFADQALSVPFGQMNLKDDASSGGQFSDADDDEFDPKILLSHSQLQYHDDESDYDEYANSDVEISDEECDVYILDPEEVEERKLQTAAAAVHLKVPAESRLPPEIEQDLSSEFPSLAVSLHVPCAVEDDNDTSNHDAMLTPAEQAKHRAEVLKYQALQPAANSGKSYNSFRKYRDLLKPKQQEAPNNEAIVRQEEPDQQRSESIEDDTVSRRDMQSRIMGGTECSGQGTEIDDNGEGWITSTREIQQMKAVVGRLDPTSTPASVLNSTPTKQVNGPPMNQRTACATTDFAMQNVILQMNLELLSVDGIKVRRLKSWVSRCGACFTVYSNDNNANGKTTSRRLFCSRCGSDMMQRVAASVDAKTGRLRLHLSKKYKVNLRGTKFSLPKPGSHNRFQGDLLLREDQLFMGAWNQKVKQLSGGKSKSAASSIFGSDLASNVGCHAQRRSVDDEIRVGFGRRNPNAATGGRERRGKKKKTGDKACGLRRY